MTKSPRKLERAPLAEKTFRFWFKYNGVFCPIFFAYFYAKAWWNIQKSGNFLNLFFLNGSDLGFVSNNFFWQIWIDILPLGSGFVDSLFLRIQRIRILSFAFPPTFSLFPVFLFFPNPLTIAHWQIGNYTPLRNTLPVQNSYDTKYLMALKTSDLNISSFKIFLRNIIDLFLVSRPTLFEDSFHQLMRLPAYELRRRLYIIFKVIQTNIHFIILNAFCIITVYNVKCEKIVVTTEFLEKIMN